MVFYVIYKYRASGTSGSQKDTVAVVSSFSLDAPSLLLLFCDSL